MIKEKNASLEEWKALYQAAKEFGEIKPWKWMTETDIFGIHNPATGEIGYCCIMGELGEVLAMAVYLGTAGLQGYMNLIEGLVGPDDPDSMFSQDCLMVSFEGREGLEKEDKALIKKLGLKFSGKRTWPLFSRYEPGFLPSPVSGEDVNYLTVVLQQAKDVCMRLKENEKLLDPPKEGFYMVRVLASQGNWEDLWLEPASAKTTSGPAPVDELRIRKIKKIAKPSPAVWEVDFFYAPTPIEAERPYYPYAIMVADSGSGFIHDMQLTGRSEYRAFFPDYFLSCIENTAMVPTEILVTREEVFEMLQPFAMKFNIVLRTVSELKAIDEARRSMTEHLQGGGPFSEDANIDRNGEEYLEKAGSELSILGLYGLLYGCHASQNFFKPSEFISIIFGKADACFETDEGAQATMGNVMALWNLIGQWDPEAEDLMIPEFQYDADTEGAMNRIYDAIAFVSYFLAGLELGGIKFDKLKREMEEDAVSLLTTSELLYTYAELLVNEKLFGPKKLEEVLKATGNAEFIIADSIANVTIGLKEARLNTVDKFRPSAKSGQKGFLSADDNIDRNGPCPCGSGRKYKKCCGLLH